MKKYVLTLSVLAGCVWTMGILAWRLAEAATTTAANTVQVSAEVTDQCSVYLHSFKLYEIY